MPIPPARYAQPFGWSQDFSLFLEPHSPWFRILGTPSLKARQPRCSSPALIVPTEQVLVSEQHKTYHHKVEGEQTDGGVDS